MSAIESLKYLLDRAEAEPQQDSLAEMVVPVAVVRGVLEWAKEATEATNHNAKLIDEERLRHEIYRRDGEVQALKFVIEKLCKS